MRSGVRGSSSSAGSAPRASTTAFTTAAGAPMIPDSPIPLIPLSVNGDGVSMCTMSMSGTSPTDGTR